MAMFPRKEKFLSKHGGNSHREEDTMETKEEEEGMGGMEVATECSGEAMEIKEEAMETREEDMETSMEEDNQHQTEGGKEEIEEEVSSNKELAGEIHHNLKNLRVGKRTRRRGKLKSSKIKSRSSQCRDMDHRQPEEVFSLMEEEDSEEEATAEILMAEAEEWHLMEEV